MSDKERNMDLIVSKVEDKPRTWNDLMGILDVSEATLSRYLQELRENDLIQKKLGSNDVIEYWPDPEGYASSEFAERLMERRTKGNKLLEALDDYGLFDEGMESREILNFLKENAELLGETGMESQLRGAETLTTRWFGMFYTEVILSAVKGSQATIDVNIQIEGKAETYYESEEEIHSFVDDVEDFRQE